jgi:hypothetical protein
MILTVLRTPKDADKGENVVLLRRGRLYLADLAGSERINKSGKFSILFFPRKRRGKKKASSTLST